MGKSERQELEEGDHMVPQPQARAEKHVHELTCLCSAQSLRSYASQDALPREGCHSPWAGSSQIN